MKNKPKKLMSVGLALAFVGAFLSLFIIGMIIGVPMILAGFICMLVSFTRYGFKESFGLNKHE